MKASQICRLISAILVAAVMFTITGCLEQGTPTPIQPVTAPNLFTGIVIMDDVKGAQSGGFVESIFAQAPTTTDASQKLSRRYAALTRRDSNDTHGDPVCEIDPTSDDSEVIPDQPADDSSLLRDSSSDIPSQLMSVGDLYFMPELQGQGGDLAAIKIPTNDQQIYAGGLPGGFPSYIYAFEALGRGNVPPFQKDLSMPELLDGVTVNGAAFTATGITLHTGQQLTLGWTAPYFGNNNNQMVLDIFAKGSDNAVHQLHCYASEDPMVTSDNVTWELPANSLSQLPATTSATFYFSRANLTVDPNAPITVRLQGLRTYSGTVTLTP